MRSRKLDIPPARHLHQLPTAARRHKRAGPGGDFLEPVPGEQPGAAGPAQAVAAAAMGRKEHQRGRLQMVGNVFHREHSAIAVADHDRGRKTPLGKPTGSIAVVGDPLAGELEGGALGGTAVPYAQDIVTAAVEGEAGKTVPR